VVDLLESKGYLKILMNPTLEVTNGQTAKVSSQEHLPIQETFIRSTDSDFFETRTEYYDVIDSLQITPHVFADGYISLETEIVMGARSIPEGVKQVPVVTERRIQNKENRIREGESLLIGGIRKTEERSVIRGVPFLKDIPLINTLF
jgi:type IV pilus assembly protein PilQ